MPTILRPRFIYIIYISLIFLKEYHKIQNIYVLLEIILSIESAPILRKEYLRHPASLEEMWKPDGKISH